MTGPLFNDSLRLLGQKATAVARGVESRPTIPLTPPGFVAKSVRSPADEALRRSRGRAILPLGVGVSGDSTCLDS